MNALNQSQCEVSQYLKKQRNENHMEKIRDLFISFFKIGILTYGGGLAMLPMLKREVVEHHHWSTEEELLDVYAISQCTPGIIAVNTATYIGYKEKGILGGIFATLGVVSPSVIIICLIASVLRQFMDNEILLHALAGVRVMVCALMINTVITMTKKGVKDGLGVLILLIAFLLATFSPVPIVILIVGSACIGILSRKMRGVKP